MAIISENEARLAASIMETWCTHTECKHCFVQKGERCSIPMDWDVPYINSSDGIECCTIRKDKE